MRFLECLNLVHKFVPMPQAMKIPDAKKHSLLWPRLLTQIWMCCKRNVSMTFGMSIQTEAFFRFVKRFHGKEKPPNGYVWSRRRLTQVQTTTRSDHVWPEVWPTNCKAAQNREKQEWENEKPKLDNARRLRGFKFVDLDDQDYKNTLKNAMRKLERSIAPALPCRRKAQTGTTNLVLKQEIACQKDSQHDLWLCNGISWIHQATRGIFSAHKVRRSHCRANVSLRWPITIWFEKSFQCHRRWKPAVDEWKKRDNPNMETGDTQWQEVRYSRSRKRFTLPHWWTHALMNAELEEFGNTNGSRYALQNYSEQ